MTRIILLLPYITALLLTLLIEGTLCRLFLKSKSWLKFTCLVNLFTNPLVNFMYAVIYYFLGKHNSTSAGPWILLLLEILVWLSEAWLFYLFGRNSKEKTAHRRTVSSIYKALLFSFVLNAASYGTGLLLKL